MDTDLVKMSPKGQLVVPQELEKKDSLPGTAFVSFSVKGGILFKKVKIPEVKAEFEKLSAEIEKQFKRQELFRKMYLRQLNGQKKVLLDTNILISALGWSGKPKNYLENVWIGN